MLLAPQLLIQGGQIHRDQRLALAHRLPHLHSDREDLALSAGINHPGSTRHNHHAATNNLGGHGPEQHPPPRQHTQGSQGQEHLPLGILRLALQPGLEALQSSP